MRSKTNLVRLMMGLLVGALTLGGCGAAPVEKLFSLQNRETQLTAAASDDLAERAHLDWNVQQAEEIVLPSYHDFYCADNAASHFYQGAVYVTQMESPADDKADSYHYTLQQATADGFTDVADYSLPPNADNVLPSPDGTQVLYSITAESVLSLYLMDIAGGEAQLIWQSPDLSGFGFELMLASHWASDSSSFVFFLKPLLTFAEAYASNAYLDSEELDAEMKSFIENSYGYEELFYLYIYDLTAGVLTSYSITPESASSLYSSFSLPYISSTDDGMGFFITPDAAAPSAHTSYYIDRKSETLYYIDLATELPDFTCLGSPPVYYDGLWYLYVQAVGIMAVNIGEGLVLVETYTFHDPIQSYAIFEDTLIVAQPALDSQGVDVTAYLLNQESKNSVLLYRNDTSDPYVTHMEIVQTDSGLRLLIELGAYDVDVFRKLILLNF